jgi:hypothetical protein
MTDQDIKSVAEGLSEAQKRTVLRFRTSAAGNNLHCPVYRDCGQMARSLEAVGILSRNGIATKLGKAVRTYLQEQSNDTN